ncbi:ATP-binding protein [Iamia majanohamensis]|uniref:ATP-binding protein n=1 Tax=Iamia majanohamensis TaxID=467976 RepID=A0AAE9Y6I8_9ACTN|nr:ATP-binding protein [Iamia majanohamensis]WCO66496.1 ATP-binding protein [Iamia majanohamensis]
MTASTPPGPGLPDGVGQRVDAVRLRVPAEPEYLALVRMVVAGTARIDPLLDDERVDDLRVIVSEACTNAIEASARRGEDASTIEVQVRLTPSRVEVVIDDVGGGFDPDQLDVLPPVTDPARMRIERGLGIPLIRALSDEAEIRSGPDGTRVRVALYAAAPVPPGVP